MLVKYKNKKESAAFLKKRNKTLFPCGYEGCWPPRMLHRDAIDESFLLLFFKKAALACFLAW